MKTSKLILTGLDERLPSLLAAAPDAVRPVHGWLRAVRQGLGLSQAEVARRLEVHRSAVDQFESAEKRRAITLASLERSARALGCELVYFLVPRDGESFADLADAHDPRRQHLPATEHSMALEDQAVPRKARRRPRGVT